MALDSRMLADYQGSLRTGDTQRARRLANELILSNVGLVRKAVNRWKPFLGSARATDYEDLYQAGLLGLLDAIRGFNPAVGAFSTYATFKILHQIQCAVRKDRLVWWPKNQGKPPAEHTDSASDSEYCENLLGFVVQEYKEDLAPALARLPETQRAMVDAVLHGQTARDVARAHKVKLDVVLSAIRDFGAIWETHDVYPEIH